MENIIYTDADLNAFLLANEEQTGNTIAVVIEADATADQELTITAGEATTTETVTPSTKNRIEVPSMLWNFGDDTVITLSKGGTDVGTITIHFPAAIDTDASLNETETDNEFTLQGSASVQDQIVSLQDSVERVSAQTLAYILPTSVDQSGIADGGSNTVETFDFEAGAENVKVAFFTCIQFLATTTVTAANAYEDLDITVTLTLDGNPIATILQAYRDGRQVLTLNHLVENLSKGNHTLTVAIAAAGGSVSVMQIVAAYLLTAKSTSSGTVSTQAIFENGSWAPGVLAEGLDANKMTESAMISGVENTIIKYALPSTPTGEMHEVSDLSEYYLSPYILCNGLYFAEPFYLVDGYFRKQGTTGLNNSNTGQPVGNTSVYFWVPIKRISGYKELQFESKTVKYNGVYGVAQDYNIAAIGAGAIVNGAMQYKRAAPALNEQTWVTHTLDISDLPYVDYILFFGVDGSPAYRNIKLLRN